MKGTLTIAVLALVAGCTTSSGVIPVGENVYSLSAGAVPGAGGLVKSKELALTEANQFCQKSGKRMELVCEESQPMSFFGDGQAHSSVKFSCK